MSTENDVMPELAVVSQASKKAMKENEKKWGPALMNAGWTLLPNMVFMRQRALGLDSLDINILMVLLSHWWQADRLPYPSKKKIAETIGCDPTTVRRRIQGMEAAGFLKRIERRVEGNRSDTNQYDFSGLIKAATPYALEEIQMREENKQERAERARRKGRPKLKVIKGEQSE